MHGGYTPRNWVLEGSNDDGETFIELRRHTNDDSLLQATDFAVFDIPQVTYRNMATHEMVTRRFVGSLFRIRITGPNNLNTLHLQCGALEFYGRALTCADLASLSPRDHRQPQAASLFGGGRPLAASGMLGGRLMHLARPCALKRTPVGLPPNQETLSSTAKPKAEKKK
jgi:hypothetical protein